MYKRQDYSWEGFQWIVPDDSKQSVIAFLRRAAAGKMVLVVCNFNPVLRKEYQMGVPNPGSYKEILNSDDKKYGCLLYTSIPPTGQNGKHTPHPALRGRLQSTR